MSLDEEPASAEAYLQAVRVLSQRVPDVMVMPSPTAPAAGASSTQAASVVSAAVTAPPCSAWESASLTAFAHLRATVIQLAIAYEEGRVSVFPRAVSDRLSGLSTADAATWRRLCFGEAGATLAHEVSELKGCEKPPASVDAFEGSQVWTAPGEGEAHGADDDDDENDDYFDDEDDGGEGCNGYADGVDDEEGMDDAGEIGRSSVSAPEGAPIPPLLSVIVSLDQLGVIRALTRSIRRARTAFLKASSPTGACVKTSEVAWIYALLAALQLPLLNTTAAVLRELYLLMLSQRTALAAESSAEHAAVAGVEVLALISGRFFAQSGR